MNEDMLYKYAQFMVKTAVNVQEGQSLIINAPVETAFFARMCTKAAYEAGAREVVVHYRDDQVGRIKMEHTALDVLCDIKPWLLRSYLDYAEGQGGCCVLNLVATDPELYKGLDTDKVNKAGQARRKALKPWQELAMSNKIQWSVAAIPSPAWAAKVFGGAPGAQEKLWQAIFDVCRISGGNPLGEWEKHVEEMYRRRDRMNEYRFAALHMRAANGTDLTLNLPEGHVWSGARENTTGGIPFLPNVPTEEVFTAPHSHGVQGVVKTSMPYVYNGNLIEGITVRFEEGRVVEYSAEKGEDLLRQLLDTDEGARRLGEIALVPASSPIRKTGLLFYNTLFDENAACHIAFGASYPDTLEHGGEMTAQERAARGMNDSLVHEDVMVGTADMDIDGIMADGSRVAVFRAGEWAF